MGRNGNVVETGFGDPMLGFVKLVYVLRTLTLLVVGTKGLGAKQ